MCVYVYSGGPNKKEKYHGSVRRRLSYVNHWKNPFEDAYVNLYE